MVLKDLTDFSDLYPTFADVARANMPVRDGLDEDKTLRLLIALEQAQRVCPGKRVGLPDRGQRKQGLSTRLC